MVIWLLEERRKWGLVPVRRTIGKAFVEKRAVIGILAHVDAGKTTLAEAMLERSGAIRCAGRVDKGESRLDFDPIEKARGITVFSAAAGFGWQGVSFTLLDTPGHVDFSAEAERTLHVLDAAVLVVDATSGVRGHTRTLMGLLGRHNVPTLVFFNKMDVAVDDAPAVLRRAKEALGLPLFPAGEADPDALEDVACADDSALEEWLADGALSQQTLCRLVAQRKAAACYFGSALQGVGVGELLDGLACFAPSGPWSQDFAARAFKVTHTREGSRLVWLKVTGGCLQAKQRVAPEQVSRADLDQADAAENWVDKADQLRVYSGERFEVCAQVPAGCVCAVAGLDHVRPGDALGLDVPAPVPSLVPVMSYRAECAPDDLPAACRALEVLSQEDPALSCAWDADLHELRVSIMGAIQLEVLQAVLADRFGLAVSFD